MSYIIEIVLQGPRIPSDLRAHFMGPIAYCRQLNFSHPFHRIDIMMKVTTPWSIHGIAQLLTTQLKHILAPDNRRALFQQLTAKGLPHTIWHDLDSRVTSLPSSFAEHINLVPHGPNVKVARIQLHSDTIAHPTSPCPSLKVGLGSLLCYELRKHRDLPSGDSEHSHLEWLIEAINKLPNRSKVLDERLPIFQQSMTMIRLWNDTASGTGRAIKLWRSGDGYIVPTSTIE
ncbi:hypothetical protein DL93DRAFT_2079430 [Clavulina sp. PMI_390]|nr:hypothetical protein DL93DRAFT_2079430 [Clavulina sp. PMI_390]